MGWGSVRKNRAGCRNCMEQLLGEESLSWVVIRILIERLWKTLLYKLGMFLEK